MDRLKQIKNEVSMEKRGINFSDLLYELYPDDTYVYEVDRWDIDEIMSEAARRYATEVARHNLERAAEQAQMSYHDGHHKTNSRIKHFQSGADHLVVDKESITSLEIELI